MTGVIALRNSPAPPKAAAETASILNQITGIRIINIQRLAQVGFRFCGSVAIGLNTELNAVSDKHTIFRPDFKV